MTAKHNLTVNISDKATRDILKDGKYTLRVGTLPTDDSANTDADDDSATALKLNDDSGPASIADWSADQVSTTLTFNLPTANDKWYWVGYLLPGPPGQTPLNIQIIKPGQVYTVDGAPTDFKNAKRLQRWTEDGAFAFKNKFAAQAVIYQRDQVASQPQQALPLDLTKILLTTKLWVAGTGRIRIKPSNIISVWMDLKDTTNEDVDNEDQSNGFKITYKDALRTNTASYWSTGEWKTEVEPAPQ